MRAVVVWVSVPKDNQGKNEAIGTVDDWVFLPEHYQVEKKAIGRALDWISVPQTYKGEYEAMGAALVGYLCQSITKVSMKPSVQ